MSKVHYLNYKKVIYWSGAGEKSFELVRPSLGSNAVQVWANYAIVSNEERKRMACAPRDILIEQVQTIPTNFHSKIYGWCWFTTQSRTVSADIRFSHAVKVLFFAAKNTSNPGVHSNYTTGVPVLKPMDENVCKNKAFKYIRSIKLTKSIL